MILTSTWEAYSGAGRLALFGPPPRGTRRGYRVLTSLHPSAKTLAAPDDVTFRRLYAAQLRETDARAAARTMLEAVYPAAPVICISGDPDEADALAIIGPWLTIGVGIPVLPLPGQYRPRLADPRTWRRQVVQL